MLHRSAQSDKQPHSAAAVGNWRSWLLAAVAATTPTAPTFALRAGAVVCLLVLVTRLLAWRVSASDVLAIMMATLATLSTTWALNEDVTALSAKNQLAVVAIFLSVRAVARTQRDLGIISAGYLLGCVYGMYLIFKENGSTHFVPELADARYGITGLNFNYLAYSLITGLVIVVFLWQWRKARSVLLLVAAFLLLGVQLSGSRGALIAGGALGLWLILIRLYPRARASGLRWIYTLVVLTIVAIPAGWMDFVLVTVDNRLARSTGDLAGRLTVWPIARDVFWQHPFTGVGAGGFLAVDPSGIGAHNVVLEVGTGMGILGLSLFAGILFTTLITGTRSLSPNRRPLLLGSLIVAWLPIYLSGHWELSPAAWVVLGIFSRVGYLSDAATFDEDAASKSGAKNAYSDRRKSRSLIP